MDPPLRGSRDQPNCSAPTTGSGYTPTPKISPLGRNIMGPLLPEFDDDPHAQAIRSRMRRKQESKQQSGDIKDIKDVEDIEDVEDVEDSETVKAERDTLRRLNQEHAHRIEQLLQLLKQQQCRYNQIQKELRNPTTNQPQASSQNVLQHGTVRNSSYQAPSLNIPHNSGYQSSRNTHGFHGYTPNDRRAA